jgi:hypothetical protein
MLFSCDQPKSSTQQESTSMSEWQKNIIAFHKVDNPDDPESLFLGPPASVASIAEFEKAIGYMMPDEFKQLYTEYDGFGTTRDGETDWFFLPVSKLLEHATEVRDWFQETHPELAKRFVPFVDWGNGDASGYVFSEAGIPLPGIFIFEHESYEFEEDQDWEEFLIPVDSSIRDFLTE